MPLSYLLSLRVKCHAEVVLAYCADSCVTCADFLRLKILELGESEMFSLRVLLAHLETGCVVANVLLMTSYEERDKRSKS